LDAAAALIIGSNIGTTVTVLLGAIKGTPAKKQVAAGHVLFNTITAVVALIVMYPLIWLITDGLQLEDPLMILVLFHSIFNFMGILLLLPFIGKIARFLEARFSSKASLSKFISRVATDVPSAAIESLKNEGIRFTEMVLSLNAHALRSNTPSFGMRGVIRLFSSDNYQDKYDELKQLEGEIVNYSLKVQNEELTDDEAENIQLALHAIRHAMQAAKNVKDIIHNIREFEASSNDSKLQLFADQRTKIKDLIDQLTAFIHDNHASTKFESLMDLKRQNYQIEQDFIQSIYTELKSHHLSESEIATLLNVNREFYAANKSIIHALSDLILAPEESKDFNRVT
jgi:phosphate:Na+ symporter